MARFSAALLLFVASGALTACGGDEEGGASTPGPTVSKKKKDAGGKAADQAAAPEEKPYVYSPVGKRDPFRSILGDLEEQAEQSEQRLISETERFELDQYRLTGLVTGTAQPIAMVEDPNGVGHALRIGDRLGKRGGVVRRISPWGLVVREQFRNATGEVNTVDIEIRLRPEEQALGN